MIFVNWIILSVSVWVGAYLLPGIIIQSPWTAVIAALVIGLVNAILKPVLILFTLPLNILTLGLFTFVINALLIQLSGSLVEGFIVKSFWWALLFSVLISFFSAALNALLD